MYVLSPLVIQCSAGINCKSKRWYHLECVGLEQCGEEEWWCFKNVKLPSSYVAIEIPGAKWIGCEICGRRYKCDVKARIIKY